MTEPSTADPSTETATAASGRAPRARRASSGSGSKPVPDSAFFEAVLAELADAGWVLVPAELLPGEDDDPEVDASRFRSAHVLSVYGPFNTRALVDMPSTLAYQLFPEGLAAAGPSAVIEAALADIEEISRRDEKLGASVLAATMLKMAQELEHPFNSATSKAACAAQVQACRKALIDLLDDDDGDDDPLAALLARGSAEGGAEAPVPVVAAVGGD